MKKNEINVKLLEKEIDNSKLEKLGLEKKLKTMTKELEKLRKEREYFVTVNAATHNIIFSFSLHKPYK
jgi:ABC-type phosphate transport system auxiliary subunit